MKEELMELNDYIRSYKIEMFNETSLIIFYALNAYLSSLINFGLNSSVTKDCLNIIKEFTDINAYEKRIFKFLKENIDTIDLIVALEFIDQMSERKEEEIVYYYKILDDIDDACEMKDEFRAKRIKKDYKSISEDQEFTNNLMASKYTIDDIMNYFAFDQGMKDFIKPRIIEVIYDLDDNKGMVGIKYEVNENNVVTDIKLVLPTILDYETLMINVNLLMKACYLYFSYSCNVPFNLEEFEIKSTSEEKRFSEDFKMKMLTY